MGWHPVTNNAQSHTRTLGKLFRRHPTQGCRSWFDRRNVCLCKNGQSASRTRPSHFWRSSLSIFPIVVFLMLQGNFPNGLRTQRPRSHIMRSGLGFITMVCSFMSFKYLSLANATALSFLVPLFTLPLAGFVLRERITKRILFCVVLGFTGVLVLLGPDLNAPGMDRDFVLGFGGGLGFALSMSFLRIFIKSMTETETSTAIAFYFGVTCAFIALFSWPFGWSLPTLETWLYLVGAGCFGGLAHIAATEAIARAPVSLLVLLSTPP